MDPIRDDQAVSPEQFKAFVKLMGWRSQSETAEMLGITQAHVSFLTNGARELLPGTSLHKLLQALLRERALLRRVEKEE